MNPPALALPTRQRQRGHQLERGLARSPHQVSRVFPSAQVNVLDEIIVAIDTIPLEV